MKLLDLHARLGRLLEDGTVDPDAEIFAGNTLGDVAPIVAIDPVNFDLKKYNVKTSMVFCFARLT